MARFDEGGTQPDVTRRAMIARQLQEGRLIIAIAAVFFLFLAVFVSPVWASAGLIVIVVTVIMSPRSRIHRRAEALKRKKDDISWERAIESILDSLDFPVFLLAGDSNVLFQNRQAIEQFGIIMRGGHLSVRIRSPAILDLVQEAMTTGQTATIEYSERVPSERWYQVRLAPLNNLPVTVKGGRRFLMTFRETTETRRIDRMRSDFVANASHELRTPLASLMGFVETLQGPARNDPDAQGRFLAIMLEQAGRMTRLIDDLLSLSRLELKPRVSLSSHVDLAALLGHVRDSLKPLAHELGVEIRYQPPDKPVMVIGDRDELIQVFDNLVENACKYAQEGKFVDLGLERPQDPVEREQGFVNASVTDYGAGIPAEHVPRLTERFYRVSIETSRSKKGTGLGLAIVKHILTRHHARLLIHSRVGVGSTFTVCLKLADKANVDKNHADKPTSTSDAPVVFQGPAR